MSSKIDLSSVPLNLRQGFHDSRLTKKGPGFKFVKGIAIERPSNPPTVTRGEQQFQAMMQSRRLGETMARTADFQAGSGAGVPAYVKDARSVLRFETYFMEAVHESASEKYRVRKITLLYYLEDHTLQLNEHKIENSGIPQGTFVKRHLCPKGDGTNVTFNDLVVGGNINLYGRTFRIVSCDAATRRWFESRDIPQPEDMGFPSDSYTSLRETQKVRDTGADSDVFRGKKSNPLKRFMEASLGNASNVQRCGVPDSLKKFLANDRKVLRFYGVWDDRDRVYGDRLFFRVHYFLSDDTMEVLEEHKVNSGRDRFPALLKRQRVSSDLSLYDDDRARGVEDDNGSDKYYTFADLCVGSTVNILGRNILLYNADDFTKDWYLRVQGIDMAEAAVDVEEKAPDAPKIQPPPHNGFGSEEDSLSSFMFLTPKVPRRDFVKLMENDKKMLRFTAKLHNAAPLDASRQFIITYYLADDTIAVFEKAMRNSGIIGGKWLSRARLKNLDTSKYFEKGDFFVGSVVTLKGHRFDLESADEFTLRLMEGAGAVWPLSNISFVMETLKRKIQEHSISARRMFRTIDKDYSGFITLEEFSAALTKWGMEVPKAGMVTIMRAYDKSGDGRIDYQEFCDAFLDREESGGVQAGQVRFEESKVSAADVEKYARLLDAVQLAEGEKATLSALMQRFAFVFRTRKGEQMIRDEFRKFDTNKNHSVDVREFRSALGGDIGVGLFNLSVADIDLLEKAFFPAGTDQLNYENFMAVLRSNNSA